MSFPVPQVSDTLGRGLGVLRLSVTDRCNLRCRYCMPAELFGPDFRFLQGKEVLSFEEICLVVSVFLELGIREVRLTGGEPLLRKNLHVLIGLIRSLDPNVTISMTTNGVSLYRQLDKLRKAGLDRINVSLDSLNPHRLREIAGRIHYPETVWHAIQSARNIGFAVKVNTVVQRGVNEEDILPIASRCRRAGIPLRFIEYMDVGSSNQWNRSAVVSGMEILERIHRVWPVARIRDSSPHSTAQRFQYHDKHSEVGFINSITEPFCRGCTRARLSADGTLYTCLFASNGHPVKSWIRDFNMNREELRNRISSVWRARSDRYSELRGDGDDRGQNRPEMWAVGG